MIIVFIIHGVQDEEVSIDHGYKLYENTPPAYKYPAWWVENRGHNDIWLG